MSAIVYKPSASAVTNADSISWVFDQIPSGIGMQKIVFTRALNPVEATALGAPKNPATGPGGLPAPVYSTFQIQCDEALILERPTVEEDLDVNGIVTASEISFKFLDTFQQGFIHTHKVTLGLAVLPLGLQQAPALAQYQNGPISRIDNFSLYDWMVCWDVATYLTTGILTLPPDGVFVDRYINGDLKERQRLVYESTNADEEFVWGATVRGKYLTATRNFFRYDAAERVITVVGYDKNKYDLEQIDVSQGLNGLGWNADPNHTEMEESPFTIPATLATRRSLGYQKLTMWNLDTGSWTVNEGWRGFSIPAMMDALYSRAFGVFPDDSRVWIGEADISTWSFRCAAIPTASFMSFGSAYHPTLATRDQHPDDANHYETDSFCILSGAFKPGSTKIDPTGLVHGGVLPSDQIYLDYSFSADWQSQKDKPYSFSNYASAWDVVTLTAASLGYYCRYSWKYSRPRVQHLFRKTNPPLVKIPAFKPGGSKVSPHAILADAVACSPLYDFGNYVACRRTCLSNTSSIGNGTEFWSVFAKLIEPIFDKTQIILPWDDGHGYYLSGNVKVNNNDWRYNPITAPELGTHYKNVFEWKPIFGLFGNFLVPIYGGTSGLGGSNEAKPGTFLNPEFQYAVAGALPYETSFYNNTQVGGTTFNDRYYASAYPGLILFAGGSSDQGKTIDKSIVGTQYFRGCGSIVFPYGSGTIESFSFLEGSALFMSQLKANYGEKRTLTLPTLSEYENDFGETGYDAAYPGLGVPLYKRLYVITKTIKNSETDELEMDLEQLPSVLDAVSPIPFQTDRCGSWIYGPQFGVTHGNQQDTAIFCYNANMCHG